MAVSRFQPDEDEPEAEEVVWEHKAANTRFLSSSGQLPAIPGEGDLYLTWDADYSEGTDRPRTVILHDNEVLFMEPASWEAIEGRYEQICQMLKGRYGSRVRDVVPTEASETWLYGDKISGSILRTWICNEVFGSRKE